jgi:hypothetical protein
MISLVLLGDLIILESLTPSVNAPLLYVSNTQPVPEMAGYSEHFIIILSKAITFSASEKRKIELLKPYFL